LALTEFERRSQALREANRVLIPLLGGARRLLQVAEITRVHLARARIHSTNDKRIHIMIIDMFLGHPLILGLYTSTQESRPIAPSQLTRRLRRLRNEVEKLRGREFTAADTIYIYITKKRLTRGAYREARRNGVLVALSGNDAKRRLANYLLKRLQGLLRRIQTKQVWKRVALFAYSLILLARRLGASITEPELLEIAGAFEKGVNIASLRRLIGPPLQES